MNFLFLKNKVDIFVWLMNVEGNYIFSNIYIIEFIIFWELQVEGKGNGIKIVIVNMFEIVKVLLRLLICKLF